MLRNLGSYKHSEYLLGAFEEKTTLFHFFI